MAKVLTPQQAVKGWLIILLALASMLGGGAISDKLIADSTAPAIMRWFGVTVAVLAIVPWLLIMIWGIGAGDEFVRQIALVGTAIAFVGDLLVHIGVAVARDAALISATFDPPPLPLAMALWIAGLGLAALYYRFRP